MKQFFFICVAILPLLPSFTSFGQKKNNNTRESRVRVYAIEANRLDLQTNADSISRAYMLHSKILKMDKKQLPSYISKICIDYKRNNLAEAHNTALAFVTSIPDYGDAWVYLGVVEAKQGDSSGADRCFRKAIDLYKNELKEAEDSSMQTGLKFKMGIVINFLGYKSAVYAAIYPPKENHSITATSVYINEAGSVEEYCNKLMNYHSLQFFP